MATLQQLKNDINDPRLKAFIGKNAIVGLYQFYEGEPVKRNQDFGVINGFDDGMMELQSGEKMFFFPIRYDALVSAPRGRYILDATGEEVIDLDFLVSWRLDLEDDLEESQWTANTAPHFASIVGKEWDFEYSYDRKYIEELVDSRGNELVGKTIMVGIRKFESGNSEAIKLIEQYQKVGEVTRVNLSEGVVIKLNDDSEMRLPPDISMIQSAPLGEYTLQSSGEVICNPDLMTMYTTTLP